MFLIYSRYTQVNTSFRMFSFTSLSPTDSSRQRELHRQRPEGRIKHDPRGEQQQLTVPGGKPVGGELGAMMVRKQAGSFLESCARCSGRGTGCGDAFVRCLNTRTMGGWLWVSGSRGWASSILYDGRLVVGFRLQRAASSILVSTLHSFVFTVQCEVVTRTLIIDWNSLLSLLSTFSN